MLTRLFSACRALLRREDFEAGIAEEVQFHIDQYTDELVRSGMAPDEAARRARIEFGNVINVTADCRDARGARLFDESTRTMRYAIRSLRKTPRFTLSTVATLALCLGSTLTIFAIVDSVLLRPLPFPAAADLVSVYNTYPAAGVPNDGCSLTNYYERRGRIPAFDGIAAYRDGTGIVGEPGATERVHITWVSPDFFSTLGLGPAIGRAFSEDETRYENSSVAILTDEHWKQRFDGHPDVIGRRIRIDGTERTVVGVLPPDFGFLSSKARIYVPLASDLEERGAARRHWGNSDMIARLAPGTSLADAQAQIDAHNTTLEATNPDGLKMAAAGFRSVVVPLHADHVESVRSMLLLLQAGALVLLAIGGVNVTNLFLIRASGRVKELAVRQAIGASRRHVVTEVMAETVLLALAGAAIGLALGGWGIPLLRQLGAEHLPLGVRIAFDVRLAIAGVGAAIALALGIAAPVAWYQLRHPAAAALQSETRGGTASRGVQQLRHGFVVAQIALAFVLLSGAALLAISLQRVMTIFPGFRPDNILTGQMTLPGKTYPNVPAILAFAERLSDELGRQPGVLATGFATNIPLSGISTKSAATVEGYAPRPGESARGIYSYSVGGDYFEALGYTLREGRFLDAADSRRTERTCVVDEDFARRHWPDGGVLGHRIFMGPKEGAEADAFRIVGVVGAVKQAELTDDDTQGAVYYPFGYRPDRNIFVVTRTSLPPETLATTLRNSVRSIDLELPVNDVRTMTERIADGLVSRRSPALLAGMFSALALLLSAVGTYGVLSYAVTERRREIALRVALGARPRQVRRQFVMMALRLVTAGGALGLAGAWLAGRALQAILFDVPAVHVATFAGTTIVITFVSIVACLAPARRAARISPMEALTD